MKAFIRFILRLLFRFSTSNEQVLRSPGPVLLIPNHVSWFDWLFLAVSLDDDWRFVTSSTTAQHSFVHRWVMINRFTFPIDPASPYAVKRMAEFLQGGGRLVLFAEGRLSRTGTLMKVFDGTGFLLHKTKAKVITCYLRGANRLPLSPHPGWKQWFPKVSADYSELLTPPHLENVSVAMARTKLSGWLRDRMILQQYDSQMHRGPGTLLDAVTESARHTPDRLVLEDATRQTLTYRRLLLGVDLLAQQLSMPLAAIPLNGRVGVLLPNVNATPVLLLALWSLGKVPAVFNFTTGIPIMQACAELAGLKIIITSRMFLEKARLKIDVLEKAGLQFLYLEDLRSGITGGTKLLGAVKHRLSAGAGLVSPQAPDDTAVILFTSGSEGVPKGVELSHRNILANIRQMLATTDITDTDRLFNCLPLFHSFGMTVGLML
ncbi:MAG TPA: AMP-binding protein, partial [Roseimicrobium sp.]|nr:AMP-binding protein [Roseimicrobium sp.]